MSSWFRATAARRSISRNIYERFALPLSSRSKTWRRRRGRRDPYANRTIPLCFILNEAATNSLKYVFGDGEGHIGVKLRAGIGFGETLLTIADNGSGIKDSTDGGSGLKVIGALARQIAAKVERTSSGNGTTVSVQFPVIA